jgi:uncharacterized protein YjbI with pentapeptide repeats
MANDEHVAILKKGVDAWNKWRDENPDFRPDLYGAKLILANLIGANLSGANLRVANLIGANLSGANLLNADLSGANLMYANMVEANVAGADLTGCRIYGVSAWRLKLEGAKQQPATPW